MKNYLLIFVATIFFASCNQNPGANQADGIDSTTINKENIVTTNANPSSSLDFIKSREGKTATEAGMFDDSVLITRLKDLLGNEYQYFKEHWNVQTPIEKENNIYTASGCKQTDCPSYFSIVYFDVEKNNLNVLIKRGLLFKLFTEKGEISLPEGMKKNQNIIRVKA